jgi:carbon-monoxide dehydrogenase catalytic subunit
VTDELDDLVGARFTFETDPIRTAELIVEHLDRKRAALKLRPMMYDALPAIA